METPARRRRFNTVEYHRMLACGVLREGERVELLGGEIREAAAIGSRHAACVRRLQARFHRRLADRVLISVQSPVELGPCSEPEPDLALLAWRDHFYAEAHPRAEDVLLVVEVSDTSYSNDVRFKLPLYAAGGVVEVWIVDLAASRVEVHLDPSSEGYRRLESHGPSNRIAPRLLPESGLRVADLLI